MFLLINTTKYILRYRFTFFLVDDVSLQGDRRVMDQGTTLKEKKEKPHPLL